MTHPPSNFYEENIIWTDCGILWKFPINNEQGMEDEKNKSFEDHIFLETHLEGWCPKRGPIKHFMELVIIGLSKNFWMGAEEKKSHILWFRDYFKDKNTLLEEIGAGMIKENSDTNVEILKS
uniref:Small ribosomal subunit protein mS31 n=2 Tax=Clastoptera arizonana TaxID=38151 RepID=A0A1B6D681_9HEMI